MKISSLAVVAASALALSATTASAAIVCNDDGECWHVKHHVNYKPEFKLHVHPDNWKWKGEHYKWREHGGHGYWRSGVWVDIH
jgi:predicted porin